MRTPYPRLLGLRATMLLFLYRRRLRAHPVQELLAGIGIAVGVALVFGVLVANTSLTSSASELVHGLAGSAKLQLTARSPQGLPERLVEQARRLPGVQLAAPVLRQSVVLVGPHGSERVQLIGIDPSLASLGGIAGRYLRQSAPLVAGAVGLSRAVARATGARLHEPVTLEGRGHAHVAKAGLVLAGGGLEAVSDSPIVVASLASAQRLTERPGRISEILVAPRPGMDGAAAAQLRRLAAGRADVADAEHELALLGQATKPNRQSTSLFSAISVMVGFLLALNAMLLTVPERRRFVAELRIQGYAPGQVLLLLLFEALVLGLASSLAGLGLGVLLSHALFQRVPSYLATAFPLGAREAYRLGSALLAVGFGVLATILASFSPALDLRPSLPPDAVFRESAGVGGEVMRRRTVALAALLGVASIALVGVLSALSPRLTLIGGVTLALATLCLMPAALKGLAYALPWVTQQARSGAVVVAVSELRAITTRSVALAGIAALAVYGCVAIGGTREDLLRGIDSAIVQYHSTADVWVTADGGNVFNTDGFPPGDLPRKIAKLPQVSGVSAYYGGLLDLGSRRLWVRARPDGDSLMIEPGQLLSGDEARAQGLLRSGGWVAVSSTVAHERRLRVGSPLVLPTPSGSERVRVAAITTNSGWPAGTITMAAADYRRWWGAGEPTALEVRLRPGMETSLGARVVREALRSRPGLTAGSAAERTLQAQSKARQGLGTLGQIATLLLVAAALAVASALSAAVWQRRARLASLKIQGYDPGQLWRGLLLESAAMLGLGSLVGALMGVYGHALAGRWLAVTTGFPTPFAVGTTQVFLTLGLVTAIALAVIAVPGLLAARVSPRLSLQE